MEVGKTNESTIWEFFQYSNNPTLHYSSLHAYSVREYRCHTNVSIWSLGVGLVAKN